MLTLTTLFFLVTGAPHYEPDVGQYDYRDMVESIVITPGCGEAVYDTEPVFNASQKVANKKSQKNEKTDIFYALDNLQKQYKNLKNVSVVVGWFGNSVNPGLIKIEPRVEDKTMFARDVWSVGSYTRKNTKRVLKVKNKIDNWGGTVSDRSLVNLVLELKKRHYEVTLYPMLFIDLPGQPWRGYIKPKKSEDIDRFFAEYNKFILHYANLNYRDIRLKNLLSGFIIGSELVGLTPHKKSVDHLISLASTLRQSMGPDVKLTYAANWDEYLRDYKTGNRPLDWLWADPNIDFVGIDAYFPLTDNLPQHKITKEMLVKGWESGVFYDYEPGSKERLPPELAPKNIEYWWKNWHTQSDGSKTPWIPKMKPIIFTEYGFFPTDGTSNEPSAFYDPLSKDSHYPPKSKGMYMPDAQSMGLLASEEFWRNKTSVAGNEGLAFRRFIWDYDVSPPERKHKKRDGRK